MYILLVLPITKRLASSPLIDASLASEITKKISPALVLIAIGDLTDLNSVSLSNSIRDRCASASVGRDLLFYPSNSGECSVEAL